MARILYLHGSSVGPYGRQTEWLEGHGHHIVGRPRLSYPRHRRRSWRWGLAFLDRRWFRHSVEIAQEALDACRPDAIVAASMGGAVAMNLHSGDTPQLLIAPAWRSWMLLRFGRARTVKPATIILHGDSDRTVFPAYSHLLLANSRPRPENAGFVARLERLLSLRLNEGGRGGYRIEGRLVVLGGEGHRCNSPAALGAMLGGVEVLQELKGELPTAPARAHRPAV